MSSIRFTQEQTVKLWRKFGHGRLYWKRANPRWRNRFDNDDIAVVIDGTVCVHYKTMTALQEDLKEFMIEKNYSEK